MPRRPPAKAREARVVDEGGVVAILLAKLVSTTPRDERLVDEGGRRGSFLAKLVSTTPRNERLVLNTQFCS